jgi:hypothetical protein
MGGIAAIATDAVLYIRIEKLIGWNRFHPFLEEHVVSLPLLAPDKYSAISSAIG